MAESAVRQPDRMRELAEEYRRVKELLGFKERQERVKREIREVRELSQTEKGELKSLALQDLARLESELALLKEQVRQALTPRDPRDVRNVLLELRAGAGGEEASLFAAELFRAYNRYTEAQGWRTHTVNSSLSEQGGFKEVIAEVNGKNVFGTLKYERGVHRVQRVPETEKQGRIHTSTVTVAVLPQAKEADITLRPEDLRIDTFRASGAGGQHVNKTSSAVRITHLPSNTVVVVQEERSQHKNKAKAVSVLRAKLLDKQEEERRLQEASERKSQVGTGDRSEKIRTYNYPQGRVTDHRIKKSWSNIEKVMEGDMGNIFRSLQEAEKSERGQQDDR